MTQLSELRKLRNSKSEYRNPKPQQDELWISSTDSGKVHSFPGTLTIVRKLKWYLWKKFFLSSFFLPLSNWLIRLIWLNFRSCESWEIRNPNIEIRNHSTNRTLKHGKFQISVQTRPLLGARLVLGTANPNFLMFKWPKHGWFRRFLTINSCLDRFRKMEYFLNPIL